MNTTTIIKKIWGLPYEEIYCDGYIIWKLYLSKPFLKNGKWFIGINEKTIREAQRSGVSRFILQIGQKEISMNVPTKQELTKKENYGEVELRPSMFRGSPPMKIYYFELAH